MRRWLVRVLASFLGGLIGAAATLAWGAPSEDWALVINGEETCAKSRRSCEIARDAIMEDRWRLIGTAPPYDLACRPHPRCFSDASLCIKEYNCPR